MKKILKWTAVVLGALIVLLMLSCVVLYFIGTKKISGTYPGIKPEHINIPTDSAAISHGKHLAIIWACTRCHGDDLRGSIFTKDPVEGLIPLLGTIPAPNLTSGTGGISKSYTDEDWVRAIRHGVKPNGDVEIFMYNYSAMCDGDLGDLISYLKQITPVNSNLPDVSYGPILPIITAVGLFTPSAEKIDHNAPRPINPVPGANKEYGKYLSALCTSCHGSNLIAPVPADYKQDDFVRAVRTGILPNGTQISRAMPPRIYGELNDNELAALWLYFQNPTSLQTQ